ncbi:MAG TPA: DUF6049 family protein [Actinomycetota bacterium]|nr:DUF6049 family protein [Actinomycetota bacterium]
MRRFPRALLAAAIAVAPLLASPPAQAQPRVVRLQLLAQTPWSTLYHHPKVQISVVATNTSPRTLQHLSLVLSIGPSYTSRLEYETSLTEGPSETIYTQSEPLGKETIGPGEVRTFAVHADLSTIPEIDQQDSRVYPARVELRHGDSVLGSLVTPIIYFVRPPEGTMLSTTWLALDGPIAFDATGRLSDTTFEASFGPGGALQAPVDALNVVEGRSTAGLPIDLAPEPALIEQAQRMARGYERSDGTKVPAGTGGAAAAASFLSSLRTLMDRAAVQTVPGPFSGPSIPSMLDSGLAGNLPQQFAVGEATLGSVADVPFADDVVRPPAGQLSDGALSWLADHIKPIVLADADTIDRPQQPLDFAPPPTATVTTSDGETVSLILPDPGVQDVLTRPDLTSDPVRAAQAVLGELAVIWKEEPVPPSPEVRGIAIGLPDTLPSTMWAPLFERLHAPFLVPVHAADLVAKVNPPGEAAALRSSQTGTFPLAYAASIKDLGRQVQSYGSMLPADSAVPAALQRDLLYAESATYVTDPAAGQQWLDSVYATTQAAFASVQPRVNRTFTFTAGEGTIPLLMGDPGPTPLRVTIELRSAQFEFPDGARQDVLLERPNQVVTFRVVAKAAGQNPIAVVVQSPSGAVIGQPVTIVVRSTAVNRIALFVTLGAAAVLALLYLRRWLRRTKTPS